MQQKKQSMEPPFYSHQLPYVQAKKNSNQYVQYIRKASTKIKKIQTVNSHSQSERIKAEYSKLCKQIKYVYGVASLNKALKNIRDFNINNNLQFRIETQASIPSKHKLIIAEANSKSKPINIGKSPPTKSITNPSQEQNKFNGHFISVIEDLQTNKKSFSPCFHSAIKYSNTKRTKPLANFLIKKIQADYLNIEKIKIQSKPKQLQNKRQMTIDDRSETVISATIKKIIKTEETQQNSFQISNLKQQHQMQYLPLITSFTKISGPSKGKPFAINSQSQISQGSPTKPKPRSLRSSSNGQSNVVNVKRVRPFNPPFETYYYRDLIWKANFSNSMIIQPPIQYEHRLRVFVGRGNNGGLIRGLIKRRIWFAVTDRIEDANFVWTQIKYLPYFNLQQKSVQKGQQKQINEKLEESSLKINDSIKQLGILTERQQIIYKNYFLNNMNLQQRSDQRFQPRNKYFLSLVNPNSNKQQKDRENSLRSTSRENIKNVQRLKEKEEQRPKIKRNSLITSHIKTVAEIKQQKMQNHLINNYIIGNKKALFKTMNIYYKIKDDYVFNYLPYTFHIEKGLEDEQYFRFLRFYYQRNKQLKANGKGDEVSTWIIKPGEFSNRGNGIKVCKNLDEIKTILKTKQKYADGTERTYIVQAYIQKPLLYFKRKFDLRHYLMITCINGSLKGYWYREGYVRTSSSQYTLNTNDCRIHLTNDAVQKMMPDYGKYQKGNKISYEQLHNYLMKNYGYKNYNFKQLILPKMKKITKDIVKACSGSIDPQLLSNNFQIYGLDFMIDEDFNLWLIQVNTNPCLQLSCPLLGSIIPKMVENALQLTLDAVYPPPVRYSPKGVHYLKKLEQQNKFDLIYDSCIDGIFNNSENAIDARLLNEEEETYEDEGQEWNEDD